MSQPAKSSRKYTRSISGKVILAFLLGAITILVSWGITRISFQQMMGTVKKLSQPNPKLTLVNRLFRDVVELDNLQREQAVKVSGLSYNPYMEKTQHLQVMLDSLTLLSRNNPDQLTRVDSMKSILRDRDQLFLDYLELRASMSVNDTLSKQIKSLSRMISNSYIDSSVVTTEKKITTTVVQAVDSVDGQPVPATGNKQSFWDKLLGRKKQPETVEKMQRLITQELNITIDTLAMAKEDSVLQELSKVVNTVDSTRTGRRDILINRQIQMTRAGNVLISQLFSMLHELEREELKQTAEDNRVATETVNTGINRINILLICFIIGAGVLIFLIFIDISRSNQYRVQLIEAKEEAEQLSHVKQRFLSNMSHELRTPLQAILGFSEQLNMRGSARPEDIRIIYQSSKHLLQTVNEVLDYARITSGKFVFEQHIFNMSQLVNEVVEIMSVQAGQKKLNFTAQVNCPKDAYYTGDAFRLKQVLYNLIGNAIKFTERGSVTLTATTLDNTDRPVFMFVVKDTGIGIAGDDINRVFNQFEQAEGSTAQHYGGTGLGLSIVKDLVESQGGTITADSEAGKGSVFTFTLPFDNAEQEDAIVRSAITPSLSNYKGFVWVVDDDPFILELCTTIFKKYGIRHKSFSSPADVLAQKDNQAPDIAFLDIRLEGMSGIELCRKLKANEQFADTTFIALTAQVLPDEKEAILDDGFDRLLMKPFMEQDIAKALGGLALPADSDDKEMFKLLYDMTGGDKDIIISVLETFVTETQKDIDSLNENIAAANLLQAADQLHRIAGRTAQIGVADVAARARNMEIAIRTGKTDANTIEVLRNIASEAVLLIHTVQQHIETQR